MGSLAILASRVGMRRARRLGAVMPPSLGPALDADFRVILRLYLSQITRFPKEYKRRYIGSDSKPRSIQLSRPVSKFLTVIFHAFRLPRGVLHPLLLLLHHPLLLLAPLPLLTLLLLLPLSLVVLTSLLFPLVFSLPPSSLTQLLLL